MVKEVKKDPRNEGKVVKGESTAIGNENQGKKPRKREDRHGTKLEGYGEVERGGG